MLTTLPQTENSGPVFLGRPLWAIPKAQQDPVSGTWSCIAVMPDGAKEEFEIVLENTRGIVTGPGVNDGYFRNDTLNVTLQIFDYLLVCRLEEGSIVGTYQKEEGSESGYWSGVRTGLPEEDPVSSDLVYLFEYQKKGSNERFYSVDPDLSDEIWSRNPEPLCRVWRNPSSILALDYTARPVPLGN